MTQGLVTGTRLFVRYAEVGLKGRNRFFFEQALIRNIRQALAAEHAVVERSWGRILVRVPGDPARAVERLRDVFGIASVSTAQATDKELVSLETEAARVAAAELARRPGDTLVPFRVETSRADKRFPLNSMEVNRRLGAVLLPRFPRLRVNLEEPDLTVGVDIREEAAYVYADRTAGPGGLPVGVSGRALVLLSGGIDSPVAAWLSMKRGLRVRFALFHSAAFVGEAAKEKAMDLVRILSRFQGPSRIDVVPFADVQTEIRKASPEPYRTILYRRMMHKIAERLCGRHRCSALVTGDAIGQVASQTLANLRCIDDAAPIPVLRPLLTYDKLETIALARRIGTFETSIRPAEDCCTVFQPEFPVTRGRVDVCREVEATFDVDRLVVEALKATERFALET